MTHNLKISVNFADAVYWGDKPFEIRKNDRGYQTGDKIRFTVVSDNPDVNCAGHELNKRIYRITYVLSGWGLENGYVALGLRHEVE